MCQGNLENSFDESHRESEQRTELNWERDSYLQKINNKTENFVRIHRTRLKNGGEGATMKKKSQINGVRELNGVIENGNDNGSDKKKGLEGLSGRMLMEVLEGNLNSLLELTAQALLERDGLAEEKTRALRILDLPGNRYHSNNQIILLKLISERVLLYSPSQVVLFFRVRHKIILQMFVLKSCGAKQKG